MIEAGGARSRASRSTTPVGHPAPHLRDDEARSRRGQQPGAVLAAARVEHRRRVQRETALGKNAGRSN